jgi:hypothetical protein
MENPDLIWVAINFKECEEETVRFYGQISILELEAIVNGKFELPFLKLANTHWYSYPDDDEEKLGKGRKLKKYGDGMYSQYQGDIFIKTETIYMIERLKHGPKIVDEEL